MWGIVKRYARLLGVPATTHHFRHSKASVLLNRGASLSEVQDILGHASPETTKRIYAHYQTQHLRDAFDRYSASAEELVAELPPQQRQPQPRATLLISGRARIALEPKLPGLGHQVLRIAVVRLFFDL